MRYRKPQLPTELVDVVIDKLVHGGQALGTLESGQKIFVWNALPGEQVRVRVIKKKKNYLEAIAEEIIIPSKERLAPEEENYLSTSPWQIMGYDFENAIKKQIVVDLFAHEKVLLPEFGDTQHTDQQWHYRNKMEYSFWGDDDGLHLALHQRGSHGKQIVQGSKLAHPAIDAASNAIAKQLSGLNTRAGDLKTIVVRCNQKGETVAALFTKLEKFATLELPMELKGLRVYYSNPKSPASVPTGFLYELGNSTLTDELLGTSFTYDVDSFFQVNLPIFETALTCIAEQVTEANITDMYAGVGSIGLSVAHKKVRLVELDPATVDMARYNAAASSLDTEVVEASTEKVLEYIMSEIPVIFDPPRAGLHPKVVERVLEAIPPRIIYMSCNPATHARDLALLQEKYDITQFAVFNFFPRTPHIETLAILTRKM